jgi:hypothetical protein
MERVRNPEHIGPIVWRVVEDIGARCIAWATGGELFVDALDRSVITRELSTRAG